MGDFDRCCLMCRLGNRPSSLRLLSDRSWVREVASVGLWTLLLFLSACSDDPSPPPEQPTPPELDPSLVVPDPEKQKELEEQVAALRETILAQKRAEWEDEKRRLEEELSQTEELIELAQDAEERKARAEELKRQVERVREELERVESRPPELADTELIPGPGTSTSPSEGSEPVDASREAATEDVATAGSGDLDSAGNVDPVVSAESDVGVDDGPVPHTVAVSEVLEESGDTPTPSEPAPPPPLIPPELDEGVRTFPVSRRAVQQGSIQSGERKVYVVEVEVNTEGDVIGARIVANPLDPPFPGMDRTILNYAEKLRFIPARRGEQAVMGKAQVEIPIYAM